MARKVEPRILKVISVCSECNLIVGATKYDLAYRHGFKRYKTPMNSIQCPNMQFSQEDGKRCEGSGKPVIFKRYHNSKK